MMSTARGAVAALVLLLAVGCADDSPSEAAGSKDRVQVELGEEFTWKDFTVSEGWQLETTTAMIEMEESEQPFITGEITNDGDTTDYAVFEFVFVGDGELQATIRCTSELELGPGDVSPMDCPGLGQVVPQGYDLIQVQPITR